MKSSIDFDYIELLSPCGSIESLKAAVQNGADAVYLGGKEFSARASAANFSNEELIEAVKYAKLRAVSVFVTVNTSIKEDELINLKKYTDFLYSIGVDGIIISDIGAAYMLKDRYENMELHASTQMAAHSLRDVKELEKAGFDRVVLARELTLEEIEEICGQVNVDIEVFVHGALCVSYSGQCLMSSMMGNRSGNRGRCAQPCRQRYKLKNTNTGRVYNDNKWKFLLSPKDLWSIDNIDKILKTGIKSLKIEGRMKKPEYVATVTRNYRKSIDSLRDYDVDKPYKQVNFYDDSEFNIDGSKKELESIFSRGFTEGFLMNKKGAENMSMDNPKNQGIRLGEVIDFNKEKNKLSIRLFEELNKGDGLSIGGGDIGRIFIGGQVFDHADAGKIVEIDFTRSLDKGLSIYKTYDKKLMDLSKESTREGVEYKKVRLDAKVYIKSGEKMVFELKEKEALIKNQKKKDKLIGVRVESDLPVDKARLKKLSGDFVLEKLSKTGNTPFEFDFIEVEVDEEAFVRVSEINALRRKAQDLFVQKVLDFTDRQILNEHIKEDNLKETNKLLVENSFEYKDNSVEVNIKIHKNEQISLLLNHIENNENIAINMIYTEDLNGFEDLYFRLKEKSIGLVYSAPGILRNKDYHVLENILEKIDKNCLDKVLVSTWGQIEFFKNKYNSEIILDTYFNIYNSSSIKYLVTTKNIGKLCLSQEINKLEIKKILASLSKNLSSKVEMIVYGHPRNMISEYCPMGVNTKDCMKDKRDNSCNKADFVLEDEKGRSFRLFQDLFCRTEIRGDRPIDLRDKINEIHSMGIKSVRIDFTIEKADDVLNILMETVKFIGDKAIKQDRVFRGHYDTSVD